MRLKRATSLKAYRRRGGRRAADVGAELGAPLRRRRRRPKRGRPAPRAQRRQQRAERVQRRLWSDPVALGEHMQVQAAEGYRGAFLELRPGLYLVAELKDEALRQGDFGRRVEVRDVTDEIVRVTDQALDALFPARRANKQAQRDESKRRAELAKRERELARREREAAQRLAHAAVSAAREQATRALPAPETPRQLPPPQRSALPASAARWLDPGDELAGCRCERRRP